MEMEWEDEKGNSPASPPHDNEEEQEESNEERPTKRQRVQHHKAIATSSASSSPERERPRRRQRPRSPTTRSTRLLRHLTQPDSEENEPPSITSANLGLQQGQPSIDYRRKAKAQDKRPTADGYVYNRRTGVLEENENTYMYDDAHADVVFTYLDLAERQPDYLLAREIGGLLGIEPIDMFMPSNIAHLKRQADSIRDILRQNLKIRDVNVATRQRLLRDFEKQKNELGGVRTRLQQLYEVMAPTVRRWYYLASMTGYMFAPAMVPDLAMQQLADTAEPLPYWLLVRHAGNQYRTYKTIDLTTSIQQDAQYWEPFRLPHFKWAGYFLQEYRRVVIGAASLRDVHAREYAQLIYLILRDAVLASCLRLTPPLSRAPPVGPSSMPPPGRTTSSPGETYQDLMKEVNLARYTWLRPLDNNNPDARSRYQGLGYHIEKIRGFALETDTNKRQIRQHAVSRNEAPGEDLPDPFVLSGENNNDARERIRTTLTTSQAALVSTQNLDGAAFLVASTLLSLDDPTVHPTPADIRAEADRMLVPGAVRNMFEQWTVAWNELSDALGGLSTHGMMHWQQLLRHLAPVNGDTALVNYIYQQLALNDAVRWFIWTQAEPDLEPRVNILRYVLLRTEDSRAPGYDEAEIRSRAMPAGYAGRGFTTVALNRLAAPAGTKKIPYAIRTSTATRRIDTDAVTTVLEVALDGDESTADGAAIAKAWRKLESLLGDMTNRLDVFLGRGLQPRVAEALRLQLMSTLVWSILFKQQAGFMDGVVDALLQDVLALEGRPDQARFRLNALTVNVPFVESMRDTWMPLMTRCVFFFRLSSPVISSPGWPPIRTWPCTSIVKFFDRHYSLRMTGGASMLTIKFNRGRSRLREWMPARMHTSVMCPNR